MNSLIDNLRRRASEFAARVAPMNERTGRQQRSSSRGSTAGVTLQPIADGALVPDLSCATRTIDPNVINEQMRIKLGLSSVCSSQNLFAGVMAVKKGDYKTYREMSKDPTLKIAIAARRMPLLIASHGYEAKDGATDEQITFIKDQIGPRMRFVKRECARASEFGWRGMEKVYAIDRATSRTIFRKLKPLMPERTKILIYEDNGDFGGFKQDAIELEPERCFLYTHEQEDDDFYGTSDHEAALRAWSNWLGTIDNGSRLQRKVSGVIVQIHYPQGNEDDGEDDNSAVAQKILDEIASGNSVAMPNLFYAANGIANQADLAGKSMWVLSTLNVGDQQGAQATMESDRRYWDVQKLRAWLVPERAITEGQFGTKAEAEAHADLLINVAEQEHVDIIDACNAQLVDDLLVYNYGERSRGSVFMKAEPIVDEKRMILKEFLVALYSNPAVLDSLLAGGEFGDAVDVDAVLDQFQFPRTKPIVRDTSTTLPPTNGNGNTPPSALPPALQKRIGDMFANANADLEQQTGN